MERIKKVHAFTKITALAICAVLTGAQIALIASQYEPEAYFYKYGSIWPLLFYAALAAAAVFFALQYFLYPAAERADAPPMLSSNGRITPVVQTLTGILFVGGAGTKAVELVTTGRICPHDYSSGAVFCCAAAAILALPVGGYFLYGALRGYKYPHNAGIWATFVILWSAAYLLFIYFRMTEPLNSPLRVMKMFTLLAIMLHYVYEIRRFLGVPISRLWRVTATLAMLFIFVTTVSELVFTAVSLFSLNAYLPFCAAQLFIGIDIAVKYCRT